MSPLDAHHIVGCACSDPIQEVWFLNWTSYALQHALNPFFTNYMLAPHGANLGANTSMPLLGLLGMPVTVTLGPVATYNLLLRLAFAASGLSMFLVLRRYTTWQPAAFLGGLLFAFSPFMVVHGQRHLFLVFLPLLPPLIPLIDDWLVRPRRSPITSGLLTGGVVALEYLVSPEVVLASGLLIVVALAALAIARRDLVRSRLKIVLTGGVAALAVFGVIAGYPIWMLFHGQRHPHGPPHPVVDLDFFREDLLAGVVPTDVQAIVPSSVTSHFHLTPLIFENGLYLGLPFVCLLAYLTVRCWRNALVAISALVGVVAAVLSLGTVLVVGGHQVLGVMPFKVVAAIPIVQNLEPARLTLFVQFAAAVILALGLDEVRRHGWSPGAGSTDEVIYPTVGADGAGRRVIALVGIAAVALVPLVPGLPYASAPVQAPAFFTSSSLDLVPKNAIAVTVPYDYPPRNDAMTWQLVSGMRFRLVGGDAFVPLPPGVIAFQTPPPGPRLAQEVFLDYGGKRMPPADETTAAAVRESLRLGKVEVVLLDVKSAHTSQVIRILSLALGFGPRLRGGVDIWTDVPAHLRRQ